MFFLGISAHILIYFLVPAFLIVCLIFNGQPDTREVTEFLPVCIMHESQVTAINYSDTYVYGVLEYIPAEEKEKLTFHECTLPVELQEIPKIYCSPGLNGHSLRAPPVMVLGC